MVNSQRIENIVANFREKILFSYISKNKDRIVCK